MKQNRLKSKVVWLAVLAQVLIIIGVFNPDINIYVKTIGTALIEIATAFGILNDPTSKNSF